jgi:hypothetical protein
MSIYSNDIVICVGLWLWLIKGDGARARASGDGVCAVRWTIAFCARGLFAANTKEATTKGYVCMMVMSYHQMAVDRGYIQGIVLSLSALSQHTHTLADIECRRAQAHQNKP